jgi:futalosine hydrolase
MSTLVAAAYLPELERLAALLPTPMARGRVMARAVGIGLVEATAGAERALAELTPARVILVGTAGALPGSGLAIGDVVLAARAELVVREVEYVPGIMTTQVEADEPLVRALADMLEVRAVTVASPIGITASQVEAERLGRRAQVEQLECFAVLAAAARAQVPATALLAIANTVGPQAAAEWKQHRVAAEAAAQAALARILAERDGRPGGA